MTPQISLDEETFDRLRRDGEVRVEDTRGIAFVVMTVEARQELQKLIYDDSEWTEEEMRGVVRPWLDDSEGWGSPGMEVYDGDSPQNDGLNQSEATT